MKGPVFGIQEPGANYAERRGSYALVLRPNQIAVVVTPRGIHLPGGGADPGEPPEQTLVREVREECGLELVSWRDHGFATQFLHAEGEGYFVKRCSYFIVEADDRDPTASEDDHTLVWMTLSQAAKRLTMESHRWALHELIRPLRDR